jgi:hypothetical protein
MSKRRALVAAACAAAIVGGLAAGTLAVGSPDGDDHARPDSVVIGARTGDPRSGPDWAVRVFTTESGRQCVDAGRYERSAFGPISADGRRVEHLPADLQGVCGAPGALPGQGAVMRFAARRGQPERTVVFGRAHQQVVAARLVRPGEAAADLPLGAEGTFIAVLEGLHDPRDLAVELVGQDGTTGTLDWE